MIDFSAAAASLQRTVAGVTDDQLDNPTPCADRRVRQLLGHLVGLTLAFRACADKEFGPLTETAPDDNGWPDAPADWRTALAAQVPALATSWSKPEAWQGMTQAGGMDMPGEVAGMVALDEIVLHGWDLAKATDQTYTVDDTTAEALLGFVSRFSAEGTPGLFGPSVPIEDEAPVLDRVLARSGRDPR